MRQRKQADFIKRNQSNEIGVSKPDENTEN